MFLSCPCTEDLHDAGSILWLILPQSSGFRRGAEEHFHAASSAPRFLSGVCAQLFLELPHPPLRSALLECRRGTMCWGAGKGHRKGSGPASRHLALPNWPAWLWLPWGLAGNKVMEAPPLLLAAPPHGSDRTLPPLSGRAGPTLKGRAGMQPGLLRPRSRGRKLG